MDNMVSVKVSRRYKTLKYCVKLEADVPIFKTVVYCNVHAFKEYATEMSFTVSPQKAAAKLKKVLSRAQRRYQKLKAFENYSFVYEKRVNLGHKL